MKDLIKQKTCKPGLGIIKHEVARLNKTFNKNNERHSKTIKEKYRLKCVHWENIGINIDGQYVNNFIFAVDIVLSE